MRTVHIHTRIFCSLTLLYSRDPICRFLWTANPIMFLDRFGIWIFQKVKPARVSIALSLLLSFAFVVLLVRVTFTCTTPIIAISGNGSFPFTPADPGTPFHCPNFFILSHRFLIYFSSLPRTYFSGEEKSRVMPQHVSAGFHWVLFFFVLAKAGHNSWNDAEGTEYRLLHSQQKPPEKIRYLEQRSRQRDKFQRTKSHSRH